MDPRFNLIAQFTATQHGLVARWQARDAGVPDWVLDELVRRGVLISERRGVYRLRGVPYTQELRWLAAVLAGGPGARLSHAAAATLHRFNIRRVRPTITVPYGRVVDATDLDVRRTRRLGDLIVVNKIPVTTKARTALDLAAELSFEIFKELLEGAVTSGAVKVEALLSILDRRGGRGVEGTVALRTALQDGLVDEKIQQELERHIARIIEAAAVPPPIRQFELTCTDGRKVVLDNAWPDRKIAIEGEGLRWHGTAAQARKTRARARSITRTGWDLYAYGWSDATETPGATREEIEAIFCEGLPCHGHGNPSQNEEDAA